MFDMVEHLPIKSQSASVLQLRREVQARLEARAVSLGYQPAGPGQFRVIELPLSMYIECRTPVVPAAIKDAE